MTIVSTAKIGRFFREIGTPVGPGEHNCRAAAEEAIQQFLETAERYGYWTATPEANAEVGVPLPPAG